jgi:hypothetical protein
MAIRSGHGNGAGVPRVEVLPPDELPLGVPVAPAGPSAPEPAGERDQHGRFIAGARTAARRGAHVANDNRRAKAAQLALLTDLGLHGEPTALAPYLADARAFSVAEKARLARQVGGGVCEGSAALMVDSAALASAAGRAAYAAGDPALGARLTAEARSNLLGAHELCAREAKSRPTSNDPMWSFLQGKTK